MGNGQLFDGTLLQLSSPTRGTIGLSQYQNGFQVPIDQGLQSWCGEFRRSRENDAQAHAPTDAL